MSDAFNNFAVSRCLNKCPSVRMENLPMFHSVVLHLHDSDDPARLLVDVHPTQGCELFEDGIAEFEVI
jgi:hypothetical protein